MDKRSTNDIYEKTMVRHVDSICEDIHVKCMNSVVRQSFSEKEINRAVNGYCDIGLHNVDLVVENGPMEDFSKYNNDLDLSKDKKALINGQLNQLHEKLCLSKMKTDELNELSGKCSSEAIFYKIDEEIKNYQEAINEAKDILDQKHELEKKLALNTENISQAKKTKIDLLMSLDAVERELAQLEN